MEIRLVQPEEALSLQAIRLRALAEAPWAFGSTLAEEKELPLAHWQTVAKQSQQSPFWLAWHNEVSTTNPVGIIGVIYPDPNVAHANQPKLISLWVAPEARRKHIGQALVQAAEHWASKLPCNKMGLWVSDENPKAMPFYHSLGYEVTGVSRPKRNSGAMLIEMSKSLATRPSDVATTESQIESQPIVVEGETP